METISERIKVLTLKKGHSLLWLAKEIGMSKGGFYSMLETGSMRVDILQKIAKSLSVTASELLGESSEDSVNAKAFYSLLRINGKALAALADVANALKAFQSQEGDWRDGLAVFENGVKDTLVKLIQEVGSIEPAYNAEVLFDKYGTEQAKTFVNIIKEATQEP